MSFLHGARKAVEARLATAYGPLGCDRFVRSEKRPTEVVITRCVADVVEALSPAHPE